MTAEHLVKALHDAIGAKLTSVVLYGSAAAGDFVPGMSGLDVLIIADPLGPAELAAVAPLLAGWEQAGNPLPQLFTSKELADSTDVFPIELLDIQQSRRVLFGPDLLADITIAMHDYRVQLERDLKTRFLLLRRRYLACAGDEERVARLMIASLSTFLVLLRAALRLYNAAAPPKKADALVELARHVKFDPQPFQDVLELKSRRARPAAGTIEPLFERYLASIADVISAVDQHLHELPLGENPGQTN